MTEAEWLIGEALEAMLKYLQGEVPCGNPPVWRETSERKLRLFCCACAIMSDDPEQAKVWWVEKWNQGEPNDSEPSGQPQISAQSWVSVDVGNPATATRAMLLREIYGNPFRPVVVLPRDIGTVLVHGARNYQQQDVLPTYCLTPEVQSIAEATWEDRNPDGTLDADRLLVLSDALEEAGCTNEAVLRHLRGEELYLSFSSVGGAGCEDIPPDRIWRKPNNPLVHHRGCWVVDLILGKE